MTPTFEHSAIGSEEHIGTDEHLVGQASFESLQLVGVRCLLVASAGGHLAQLQRLAPLLGVHPDSTFVTFDSPQLAVLEATHDVTCVPYIAPRDLRAVLVAKRRFAELMASGRWDAVVSTGSGIALSALPFARRAGLRSVYIESYSRFAGPSLTGRLLARVRSVETYTQHAEWASQRWQYSGCVFDAVRLAPRAAPPKAPRSVFVTLGTIRPYRFDALVDQVRSMVPDEAEITWQLGATTRTDLPGRVFQHMSSVDFRRTAIEAGVVISHAGTGSAIDMIEMGVKPILVPRRASRNEHVDDHQLQIARDLGRRNLVTVREVADLRRDDLERTATAA